MKTSPYFLPSFIEMIMQKMCSETIKVRKVTLLPVDNSASILVALTSGMTETFIGHFGLAVTYEKSGLVEKRNMVMKIKPNGSEISEMINSLSAACGGKIAGTYKDFKNLTGFHHSHMREIEVYSKLRSQLMPEIFGVYADPKNEVYIILMEFLENVELLNSVMAPELWTDLHIKQALDQLAHWHAEYYDKDVDIDPAFWSDKPSLAYMLQLKPVWDVLLDNVSGKHPQLYNQLRVGKMQAIINDIPNYWLELESMKKTLVHNDMNPRNACFKINNGALRLCLYDWELATFHIPQYDVVEFLCFVLDGEDYEKRLEYMEYYRLQLQKLQRGCEDKQIFFRGFQLAAYDFGLHRLGMYMIAHTVVPYPYLPRVIDSYFDTLDQLDHYLLKDFSYKA